MTTPSVNNTFFKQNSAHRQLFLVALCVVTGLIATIFPAISAAHGPTRQVVKQQIMIQAPTAEVWAVAGDFFALDKWHPAILRSEKIDDKTRKLNLDEEGKVTLTEELKELDPDGMKLKYKIIDMTVVEKFNFSGIDVTRKALPVDNYSSTIQVVADGDGSVVTWVGKFYRAYLLNPPTPEGMDDATAIETIQGIYNAGLENLAKQFDGDTAAKATSVE